MVNVAQTEINFHYPNSVQSISSADGGGGGGEEDEEHLKLPSSGPKARELPRSHRDGFYEFP